MLPGAEEALPLAMIWRCQMRRCDAARRIMHASFVDGHDPTIWLDRW
jgi:hypothetical protein